MTNTATSPYCCLYNTGVGKVGHSGDLQRLSTIGHFQVGDPLYIFGSVYEKLFETSDIMSDAFELCVGHFYFMLDIFLFNIKTLDSVIKNSHIYAKIRDILTPTQTFDLLDNLTMCQTFCLTF